MLEALGNLGDFIGGIAVVATLIYLALQIRQNTTALRTSSYAQAADPTWDLGALVIQNTEFARIFRVGAQDPSQLNEDERMQFDMFLHTFFFSYENLYRLAERGLIDSESFEHHISNALPFFGAPGVRQFWGVRSGHWSERFQAFLGRSVDS